jgi:hypothetical protein
MNDFFTSYCRQLFTLHLLIAEGKSHTEAADEVRDSMDDDWDQLSMNDKEAVGFISGTLSDIHNESAFVSNCGNDFVTRALTLTVDAFNLPTSFRRDSVLLRSPRWRLADAVAEGFYRCDMGEARNMILSAAIQKSGSGTDYARWLLGDIVAKRDISSLWAKDTARWVVRRPDEAIVAEVAYFLWLNPADQSPLAQIKDQDFTVISSKLRRRKLRWFASLATHLQVAGELRSGERAKAAHLARVWESWGGVDRHSKFMAGVKTRRPFDAMMQEHLAREIEVCASEIVPEARRLASVQTKR